MLKGKKAKGKKVAPDPAVLKKQEAKKVVNHLSEKRPKNFGTGQDIQPKTDLTCFVKWPHYVRFWISKTATQLLTLAHKYRPETWQEQKQRLLAMLRQKLLTRDIPTRRPLVLLAGVTTVITLVADIQDVDLIELVVFLPALSHKMEGPLLNH
ncbi:hypothetical protein P7K49_030046 [Saguinus oedipus]|uniref:60S ribosomal protein L7a n=1 Tax=Saguinus oedipus TaxID=9490 RepID=A0ABQ9U139_SAGOE|nr:hypothetical protein P7K49_030046 [Saguinus oedipus]